MCINLGCGFDDKFPQVDNGKIRWYDVDLADQIAVRRKVFEDRERCIMMDGDAYAGYIYSEGEVGMTLVYKDRQAVSDYICGFVRAMIKNSCLYTIGPEHEGYIAYYPSWKMMKPAAIAELLRTFGSTLGIRGVRELIDKLSAAGESYEDNLKKAKKKYIFVALVAVPEEYQGEGYMRKLMEFAFEKGRENNCPVILETDDAMKKAKYEHLGMKTVRTRKIADNSFMYDLIREPDGIAGTA